MPSAAAVTPSSFSAPSSHRPPLAAALAPLPHAAPPPRRESADSVLAKNLVVARLVAGLTQQELAAAADVSRATIAQIETGYSDPRLSTIVELARALQIPPLLLLTGTPEVLALTTLRARREPADGVDAAAGGDADLIDVSPTEAARMAHLVNSGMLKDRVRAGRIGAGIARAAGKPSPAVVAAAIFSAIHPGPGTAVGALLGELTDQADRPPAAMNG